MLWRYLFCACLLTIAVQSVLGAEGSSRRDVTKKHVRLKCPSSNETAGVLNHRKSLFARRGHVRRQKPMALQRPVKPKEPKPLRSLPPPAPPPAPPTRRCPKVTESCNPRYPCCDPCTTCHCRFFNTICYCWRLGRHCQLKS